MSLKKKTKKDISKRWTPNCVVSIQSVHNELSGFAETHLINLSCLGPCRASRILNFSWSWLEYNKFQGIQCQISAMWVSALECCALGQSVLLNGGKTCQSSWLKWPQRIWHTRLYSLCGWDCFVPCTCLFMRVFMETAVPFRYITEPVWYSIRLRRGNWSGCPAGIYCCSVARVNLGSLILFERKENWKHSELELTTRWCFVLLSDLFEVLFVGWDQTIRLGLDL